MPSKRIATIRDFFKTTIWTQDLSDASFMRRALNNTSKVCAIAVRRFLDDRIIRRAADLTYSTLFALVPILALIFAVAKGFGFENIVEELLKNGVIGQEKTDTVMQFIQSYLQFTHNGLFVGSGLQRQPGCLRKEGSRHLQVRDLPRWQDLRHSALSARAAQQREQ